MLSAETQPIERELIGQYLDVRRAIYRKLPDLDYDGAEMRHSESKSGMRCSPQPGPGLSLALRFCLATVVGWLGLDTSAEVESTVDECKMRECLRKISQLAMFFGVVFFR